MSTITRHVSVQAAPDRVYTAAFIGTNLVEIRQNNVEGAIWAGPFPIAEGAANIEPPVVRRLNEGLAPLARS